MRTNKINETPADSPTPNQSEEKPICGIIMPISQIDDCDEQHWLDVKSILNESIQESGYKPRLVSESNDSSIIQKRIVQNIYNDTIVVCDVSCQNPNVMFELGMRLAFDKPTIIIIDDKTPFCFDTNIIEHLRYRRDLRYQDIIEFKKILSKYIKGTIETHKKDPNYSTFLKQFQDIKPKQINSIEGSKEDIILDRLDDIERKLSLTRNEYFHARTIESIRNADINSDRINQIVITGINNFCKERNIKESDLFNNMEAQKDCYNFIIPTLPNNIQKSLSYKRLIQKSIESNVCPF